MPTLPEKSLQRYASYSLATLDKLHKRGKLSNQDLAEIVEYASSRRLPFRFRLRASARKRLVGLRRRLPKRSVLAAYLADKWIDLLALIVAILALIRTI